MPFSTVAHYSSDKGSDLCGQSCDDLSADFFEQFLTFDPTDNERRNVPINSEGPNFPNLPESTHLVKSARNSNTTGTSSSSLCTDRIEPAALDSEWNWPLSQTATSSLPTSAPGSQFYSEVSGRAANSESELLSLDNFTIGSPISPLSPQFRASSLPSRTSPATPTPGAIARRRALIKDSAPKLFKKAHSFDRSPIRKHRTSPKMVLGSQTFENNLDVWGNKVNSNPALDFEHPLSPPQSARASDATEASRTGRFVGEDYEDFMAFSNGLPHQFNSRASGYDTPLATPVLDGHHSRRTSSQNPFSENIGFPPTPQFHQGSGSWSQGPCLSEFNTFETPANQTPETETAVWWNHAATAPMAQPSPTTLHVNPRRATKSLAHQLQIGLPYESHGMSSTAKMPSGLMIQMTSTGAQQSFVVPSPLMPSPHVTHEYFSHPPPRPQPCRHQYPPPTRSYVPATDAHPQHSSTMRRAHSSTRGDESPSPKTKTSSFHIRKRRTTKESKKAIKKAAKNATKTSTREAVDFVNFTPDDSRKILTGVAPSGSSKTKARREMEAMEKRRNLSMAALRAVRAAGGDVDSLVKQGLFV